MIYDGITIPAVGDLSEEKERKRIINALYEIDEKLRYTLNNIETDNLSSEFREQIESIGTLSQSVTKLTKIIEGDNTKRTIKEVYDELVSEIIKSANEVTKSFDSYILQMEDRIKSYVSTNYRAKTDKLTLDSTAYSQLTQTTDLVELLFGQDATITPTAPGAFGDINSSILSVADSLEAVNLTLQTYFDFSQDGLTIGKRGDDASPMVLRLSNDRISFILKGATDIEIAYITGQRLYIFDAVLNNLIIGTEETGYIKAYIDETGLSVTWESRI